MLLQPFYDAISTLHIFVSYHFLLPNQKQKSTLLIPQKKTPALSYSARWVFLDHGSFKIVLSLRPWRMIDSFWRVKSNRRRGVHQRAERLVIQKSGYHSPVEGMIVEIYHYLQGLQKYPNGGWEWDFSSINRMVSIWGCFFFPESDWVSDYELALCATGCVFF